MHVEILLSSIRRYRLRRHVLETLQTASSRPQQNTYSHFYCIVVAVVAQELKL